MAFVSTVSTRDDFGSNLPKAANEELSAGLKLLGKVDSYFFDFYDVKEPKADGNADKVFIPPYARRSTTLPVTICSRACSAPVNLCIGMPSETCPLSRWNKALYHHHDVLERLSSHALTATIT